MRLRQMRLKAGIKTQKELLDALSERGLVYEESFWSKVESGKRRPSREHLFLLLKFFQEQKVAFQLEDVQALLREAGYASLSKEEVDSLFGVEASLIAPLPSPSEIISGKGSLFGQAFDYTQVIIFGIYSLALESWRNFVWDLFGVPDSNWKGLIVPVIFCCAISLSFLFVKTSLWRAILVLCASILSGVMLILLFHQPGIITPVLNVLGGSVAATLVFSHGPAWILPKIGIITRGGERLVSKSHYEHDLAKLILQVSVWMIGILAMIGIAMNVILFMSSPEAFSRMPHQLRVARGIEILLAIVMILVQLGIWWFLPLVRFLAYPIQGD